MTNHDNNKKRKIRRILVVDDEADITFTIEKVLENYGFAVDSYNDAVLALSNFKPGLYDLLLLDIRMPKVNGFELHKKIREIDSNLKICFLTASEFFYQEYRRDGIYRSLSKEHFIQKPFRSEDLVRQLNEILHSS